MRTEPERAARALHSDTRLGPRRGYYYQLAASTGWSSLPFLRLIRQPTLIVAGDDDPIIPVGERPDHGAAASPTPGCTSTAGGHIALVTEAARARAGDRGLPRRLRAFTGCAPGNVRPSVTICS